MKHLYRMTEWQGGSGSWYCNDVEDLGGVSSEWWIPARFLGLTPEAYVSLVITDFKPDHITFNGKTLVFSWDKQSDMRKFKNWINAKAREKNVLI